MWGAITGLISWILESIFKLTGNYGISIIVFTIITTLALFPLTYSSRKNIEISKKLQPKIRELQNKYKNDPETLSRKQMQLFREHNYSPLSGCLPLLIQTPIMFALFSVLRRAGEFMPAEAINQSFLWLPNMIDPDTMYNIIPSIPEMKNIPGIWPIIAAIFTYITMSQSTASAPQSNDPNAPQGPNMGFMKYTFPIMILIFGSKYAAGLIVYWGVSNILRFIQELVLSRMFSNKEGI